MERKRPVFARKPLQFPPRNPRSCAKTRTHCRLTFRVCRGREASEAKVTMDPLLDNRADIIWRVPACELLVNIGIRPSANSIKQKRVVRRETRVCSRIIRLMNNKTKGWKKATSQKEEKVQRKALWLSWKAYHNWVVYDRTRMHSFLKEQKSFGETRCRKSWTQFEKFDSLSSRNVKRVSGKRKDHRWEKQKSILVSEVTTLQNSRIGPTKRLDDNSDVPKARLGILPKIYTSSKRTTGLHSSHLQRSWFSQVPHQESREWEREFVVDSGASMHMVSDKDLNSAEFATMRTSRSPTTVMTANGEVRTNKEAKIYVKQLDLFVKVMLLQETPAVLSLGKLCDEHGYTYYWKSGQNPHLIKNGKKIDCNISNYVPFVVLGLSASSSSTTPSPTSSSSSSQDSVFDVNRHTENPVPERSGSASEELRGDPLHESTGTENKNINGESEEVQRDISHELPDWLQEFRENLLDESTSQKRRGDLMQKTAHTSSSSHNSPMEPRAHVEPGSGMHSVFTHFPKDPNCEICLKTKITRASCRRRANAVMPRAENFGDLITADHKVLSEESESRNNHRYAVVVQDWATQWLQSYPCKTNTSQETQKSVMKLLEPTKKTKVIYTLTIHQNSANPVKNYPGIIVRQHHTDQKQMGLQKEQCVEWKKGHLRCCSNQVWTMNGWWILWNVTTICEIFRTIFLMGKHTLRKAVRNALQRTNNSVWSDGRMSPYLCKRPVANASVRLKSNAWYISRLCIVRWVESGKETLWSQTLKKWRRWTHLNSTPEGSMQRKC